MAINLKERASGYFFPLILLRYALKFLLESIAHYTTLKTSLLDHAFARWFEELGHNMKAYESTTNVPTLLSSVQGTILELGPATGNQLDRFPSSVTHIYGIEPNPAFQHLLSQRLAQTPSLHDKYTILTCGIEDTAYLSSQNITEGSVDCVVSTQVLCSVTDPNEAVRCIWRLLKPGGTFVFWEHCRSEDVVTRFVQRVYDVVWRPLIGNCSLRRPMKAIILGSGDWEVLELGENGEPWDVLPRVWGRLKKVES